MLGEADKGSAHWELSVFRNRFVKENGLWKLKELRLYPLMRAEYAKGWGKWRPVPDTRTRRRLLLSATIR